MLHFLKNRRHFIKECHSLHWVGQHNVTNQDILQRYYDLFQKILGSSIFGRVSKNIILVSPCFILLKNHPFQQIQTKKLEWNDIKFLGNQSKKFS